MEQIITYLVRSSSPLTQPFVLILDTVQLELEQSQVEYGPKTSTVALLHKFYTDSEFQSESSERMCFGIWMRKRRRQRKKR